jgi:hypothetical protein
MARARSVPGRRTPAQPGGPAAAAERVLALQRGAGNRATGATLARAPATLDTEAGKAKNRLQVSTAPIDDRVDLDDLDDFFQAGSNDKAKPAASQRVRGNPTVVYGDGIPKSPLFRAGLQSIAGVMLERTYTSKDPRLSGSGFREDTTVEVALDLSKYGGQNGLWRFTLLELKAGGKELLIEVLDPRAADTDERTLEQRRKRFERFGFKMSGYREGQRDALLEAVSLVPDTALDMVRDLRFARDGDRAGDEAGVYDPGKHTVTMFDRAFTSTLRAYDSPGAGFASEAVREILHEIGHAVDLAAVRKAIAAYNRNSSAAGAQAALDAAVSESGTRAQGARGATPPPTAFLRAVKLDGKAITKYGETASVESYAEAFSLWLSDPVTLKALRPNVAAYFETRFRPAAP